MGVDVKRAILHFDPIKKIQKARAENRLRLGIQNLASDELKRLSDVVQSQQNYLKSEKVNQKDLARIRVFNNNICLNSL